MTAPEPIFGRLERRAALFTVLFMAVAWFVPGGGAAAAGGVVGGACLSGVSYWAIKRSVGGLTDAFLARGAARPALGGLVLSMIGRYALLAFMAYVMIARLRLHPLGLLGGASIFLLAAAVEATRR